jgi:hypothetical protein
MRKSILIIAILSIAALCFAGPLQEMHKRVIAGSTVAEGEVTYGVVGFTGTVDGTRSPAQDFIYWNQYTATASGTVGYCHLQLESAADGTNICCSLYATDGTQLAYGSTTTGAISSATHVEISLSSTTDVTSSTEYLTGIVHDNATQIIISTDSSAPPSGYDIGYYDMGTQSCPTGDTGDDGDLWTHDMAIIFNNVSGDPF